MANNKEEACKEKPRGDECLKLIRENECPTNCSLYGGRRIGCYNNQHANAGKEYQNGPMSE